MDEFSFKETRTLGQYKISFSCICVWCESGELGRMSSSNDGSSLRKQPVALTRRLFLQESSTTDLRPDSKCGSAWRRCESGVWVDCMCIEFVAAGWCTKKRLSFDQTIRDLTSGDADCFG